MPVTFNIFSQIVNFGINNEWDFDKQRTYRQVNRFNIALAVISLSAWPIAIFYKVYIGLSVQIVGFILYLAGFLLIKKGKLRKARLLALSTFEIHMFLISFFAIRHTESGFLQWYSPVFAAYMLYPLTAALFDKSILRHMVIAFLQILVLQFAVNLVLKTGIPAFPEGREDILNFIICIYTILMASSIVYLTVAENKNVKEHEIERAKELEKVLGEVKTSREMISQQTIELKKLNDSKDTFFSIVAHDLKSPYNTLLGFSAMLKESLDEDTKVWEYANNLYDSALNNFNLLENLLEWTRSQRGKIQFNPTVFCLNEVIYKTVNLVSLNAEKKNISITDKVSNDIFVSADRNLVNIIIRNILTNAIKYTYNGGEIIIDAKISGRYAEISISDNGIGIPDKILKNLFSIENKDSRVGTAHESGTGLGLILCKEFIDLHGCSIWVESEVKKGSTFYFTLPYATINNLKS